MSDDDLTRLERKDLEMATKGIEMAHNQIPLRVGMRDNVLLAYLAATGVIYGIAFKGDSPYNTNILLLIPFLALGSTIIVSHHNILISALINFCSECSENINSSEEGGSGDNSDEAGKNEEHSNKKKGYGFYCSVSFRDHLINTLCFRTLGHGIILLVPAIIALWSNRGPTICLFVRPGWFFLLAFCCFIVSFLIIIWVTVIRIYGTKRVGNMLKKETPTFIRFFRPLISKIRRITQELDSTIYSISI